MNNVMIKCFVLAVAIIGPVVCQNHLRFWCYECRNDECKRVSFKDPDLLSPVGLTACRLSCGGVLGTVWPKPSGPVEFDGTVAISRNIKFFTPLNSKSAKLWQACKRRFEAQLDAKVPEKSIAADWGKIMTIRILIPAIVDGAQLDLTYDTDESYTIEMNTSETGTIAVIKASTYFGGRHGLETLSQLIVFDEINFTFVTLANAMIDDSPKYKHRGLMLDTASNYFSIRSIERTIDAMAMVKLNRFHWHIVDSSSFPLVIKSQPDLHSIGAYSPYKIYTHEAVIDLVEYARVRGVRIYPEFDIPAHAGEGWQLTTSALCLHNRSEHCLPAPWGQLDPTNNETFVILNDIFREAFQIFDPDMLHLGGSQVNLDVWDENKVVDKWSEAYSMNNDVMNLWSFFHVKALHIIDEIFKYPNTTTMVWASALPMLQNIQDLDKSRIVLQVAQPRDKLSTFLKHGFSVVVSSTDKLFLGCDSTYRSGQLLHCSKSDYWRIIYEDRYDHIPENRRNQILGAEAVLYSKFSDEFTVDSRFWPRASALAERLWSNPSDTWRSAESRMMLHRQRLIENGIAAEALQSEWCLQNQNECNPL